MKIQAFEITDLASLTGLQPSGWGPILPSYTLYLQSNFCFPIKATIGNKVVGIGAGIAHGRTAWLAQIVVHPDERSKGIGYLLTQTLIGNLKDKGCDCINLIATDLGAPLYEKIGFTTDTDYLFFKDLQPTEQTPVMKNIFPLTHNNKEQVIALDRKTSGEDRIIQLESHFAGGYVFQHEGVTEGFLLPTLGEGLIVSATPSSGEALMTFRLASKENASFPKDNIIARDYFYQRGYKEFKTAKRMRLGQPLNWQPQNLYNRIGGNLG